MVEGGIENLAEMLLLDRLHTREDFANKIHREK
jgi:hypothetical protein